MMITLTGQTDSKSLLKNVSTVGFSVFAHGIILAVLLFIPLIYTDALPLAQIRNFFVTPPAPPPPRARAVQIVSVERHTAEFVDGKLRMPQAIPSGVPRITDDATPAGNETGASDGVDGGVPGSNGTVPWGLGSAASNLPPPPPPPPSLTPKRARIPVVSTLQQANLVYAPKPIYPTIARTVRVEGTVVLEAVISKDGTVQELKLVTGHPFLVSAAVETVRTWRYRPTILNGEPVEVVTTITVNFKLTQN
jgi:protein TonB